MSHIETPDRPEAFTGLVAIALFVPLLAGVYTSCDGFKKKSSNVVVEQQAPPPAPGPGPSPGPSPGPGPTPSPSPSPGSLQNQWVNLNSNNPPAARAGHSAVWTGTRMIVWGGTDASGARGDGASLDPVSGTWNVLGTGGAPSARFGHGAAWNGNRMIIWGGTDGSTYFNDGFAFDPGVNAWTALTFEDTPGFSPAPRSGHSWVFTGNTYLMWGGGSIAAPNGHIDGGHYLLNSFWSLLTSNPPAQTLARIAHSAVWTGTRMIMFGGQNNGVTSQDGFIFDPNTNVFTPMPIQTNTPANRSGHAAVWTGTKMLVWGGLLHGITTSYYGDGRIYDFATAGWSVMSNPPAGFAARAGHTAVWAGDAMIIWGGTSGAAFYDNGAVFH